MEKLLHCPVCYGQYSKHEINSPECYEKRIANKDRVIRVLGNIPTVCPTCRVKVKAKHLMDTVKGNGCIHCVDRDYVHLDDPEIVEELSKEFKQYDDVAAVLWGEEI
jgi:hypothetical protein